MELVGYFPHTPHEVGVWTLGLMVLYLIAASALRRRLVNLPKVLDAGLFAGSVLLLMGVIDEKVTKALGDTTLYLIIAGLIGVLYCLRSIDKE
jgi:hypothetical protein